MLLPSHPPRGAGRRRNIPAGHPKALSWDVLPWEEDDWAWYVVAHQGALTLDRIADLMGLDEKRVRQIEAKVIEKLRVGLEASLQHADRRVELTPEFIRGIFTLYDRHRHDERRRREKTATVSAVRKGKPEQAGSI